MARRTAEGKSRLEAPRCLKNNLADVALHTLADVDRSAKPAAAGGLTTQEPRIVPNATRHWL
jgi:hypothetical protein